MISRNIKLFYYKFLNIPMRINGIFFKIFRSPRTNNIGVIKVQLGPGQKSYIDGWINLDANFITAKCDVWANLEHPLPFKDSSIDVFYSHHVIEHLEDKNLVRHFRDMYRALKPGGMIRVGGPNGDMAIRKFIEGDIGWFGNFPDKHESIGGKLKNFIFCRNEHLTILTQSYLQEITKISGFERITFETAGVTTTNEKLISKELLNMESWSSPIEPRTIIVECYKPIKI
jgi:predicted SAM-dependent methyltransferase